MFKEAETLGLPEPEIIEIGMRVQFTIHLAESMTLNVPREVNEQVTKQIRKLLSCLQKRPLGSRETMQCIGLNHRPTFVYDYLKPAIDAGFVEMTQPESPKSPTQKYRLTTKGITLLAKGYNHP